MTGLLHLHSFLRYAAVILMIWTIIHAFMNMKKSEAVASKWSMISMIVLHSQFLIGLILWISKFMSTPAGEIMKVKDNRYFIMEHSLMMLIGIVLISIGHIKGKKTADMQKRYKTVFTFFLIGFIIIMAMIPWPFFSHAPVRGWF
ncbi:MAG: hypothetical protein RL362_158 [Bacteroidota bacterium]